MAKSLHPQTEEKVFPIKVRERELKIVVCVSLVWCISFLFLLVAI